MTNNDLDFDFAAWRLRREQESTALRQRLHDHIAAGGFVAERFGAAYVEWGLAMARPSFLAEYMTADHLAEHLQSRHDGFGTDLEFLANESAQGDCPQCGGRRYTRHPHVCWPTLLQPTTTTENEDDEPTDEGPTEIHIGDKLDWHESTWRVIETDGINVWLQSSNGLVTEAISYESALAAGPYNDGTVDLTTTPAQLSRSIRDLLAEIDKTNTAVALTDGTPTFAQWDRIIQLASALDEMQQERAL